MIQLTLFLILGMHVCAYNNTFALKYDTAVCPRNNIK